MDQITEIVNNPTLLLGIINLVGVLIIGFWTFRSNIFGASEEISKSAIALIEPLEKRIATQDEKLKRQGAKIDLLIGQNETNLIEIDKLQKENTQLKSDYNALIDKYDIVQGELKAVKNEYQKEKKARIKAEECNHKLQDRVKELQERVEKLEKVGTGELNENGSKE